jgi:hypothetical protein
VKRRTLVLAASALLAVGLTACDPAEDAVDTGGPAPSDTLAPDTMDQLYLSTVREGAPSFADINDATLIEFGQAVCSGFDGGATFTELATMGLDSGLDNIDLGFTMGVAVAAYCPEYSNEVL